MRHDVTLVFTGFKLILENFLLTLKLLLTLAQGFICVPLKPDITALNLNSSNKTLLAYLKYKETAFTVRNNTTLK